MLSTDVERYLEMKRLCGVKFRDSSAMLRSFASFAEGHGDTAVRTDRVLEWAAQAPSPLQRHRRFLAVRNFALTMRAEDDRHDVPAADAPPSGLYQRPVPHIYTPEEVARLINAAAGLGAPGSFLGLTYATLFGLLAVTGMRVSEALSLRLQDVVDGALIVRETKFRKSRMVFLHDTAEKALDTYILARKTQNSLSDALFISRNGQGLPYHRVHSNFLRLSHSIGLKGRPERPHPRLHDLRHTFAVRSLEQCPHDRTAVLHHAAALATYLGHSRVANTYWYLEATPVLLNQIAAAGEQLYLGGPS